MGQSSSRTSSPASRHSRHASSSQQQVVQAQNAQANAQRSAQDLAAQEREREKEREAKLYGSTVLDHGFLAPQNALYDSAAADWDARVVRKLILERKLAPFYKGVNDPVDGESTTTTLPEPRPKESESPVPPVTASEPAPTPIMIAMGQNGPGFGDGGSVVSLGRASSTPIPAGPARFIRHSHTASTGSLAASVSSAHSGSSAPQDDFKPRSVSASVGNPRAGPAQPPADPLLSNGNLTPWISREDLWRNPIECPICFLYYPRNINWSRCCDQPVCTECFVQISRPESGDAAACPFCVETHFGIIYFPPNTPGYNDKTLRGDLEAPHTDPTSDSLLLPPIAAEFYSQSMPTEMSPLERLGETDDRPETPPTKKREGKKRRESMGYKAPGVVTVDELRPDWFRKHQQLLLARSIQEQQRRYASLLAAGRPLPPPVASTSSDEPDLLGAAQAAAALVESMAEQQAAAAARRRAAGGTSGSGARPPRSSRGGNQPLREQRAIAGYFDAMRHMGADLEELMMMEAVRRSLQDVSVDEEAGPSNAAGSSEADLAVPGDDTDQTAGNSDSDQPQAPGRTGKPPIADSSSPVLASFLGDGDDMGASS